MHLRPLLFTLIVVPGWAQEPPSRASLQDEIQRIESQYATDEAECHTRFVVASCVDDARRRRREALEPARARLLAYDDAERREKAQERLRAIDAKKAQVAQRPEAPALETMPTRRPLAAPAASASRPHRGDAHEQAARAAGAAAAERAGASARRRQEMDKEAERIRERIEKRERKGNKAAPLPVPGASAPR